MVKHAHCDVWGKSEEILNKWFPDGQQLKDNDAEVDEFII
jgi:hypothetical protein